MPTSRLRRTRCPPTSAPSSPRPPGCSRAIPANDLNELIGELATSLQGQAGNLRTLISAGTTFSKEFVAYQQQFTELLANAPPTLDAITAVAPELRQDLANTAALVQVLAQQKSGLHTLLTAGSSAFNEVDNLVTSQSANIGCFLHDTADILSNIAQPANLNNLSQGLAYNQYFFGAVDQIAVQGPANPTTTNSAQDPDQTFLRTRLLFPPILNEPGSSYSTANGIPDTLPGAGCVTVFGNGVGTRHPTRLHTGGGRAAGGAHGARSRRRTFGHTRAGDERVVPRAGRPSGDGARAGRPRRPRAVPRLGRAAGAPSHEEAGVRDLRGATVARRVT